MCRQWTQLLTAGMGYLETMRLDDSFVLLALAAIPRPNFRAVRLVHE
jgi:hypothetical protein